MTLESDFWFRRLLFFNYHRRAFVSGVVEMLRHSFWQPDAAMRRRIGRDVAFVHRVATL